MGRINVTSSIFVEPLGSNTLLGKEGWREEVCVSPQIQKEAVNKQQGFVSCRKRGISSKLTWLVLGGDPAARSHRVEQFIALRGL